MAKAKLEDVERSYEPLATPRAATRYLGTRAHGKAPKRYEEGRRCEICGTKLSVYNPDTRCYQHRRTRFPRVRGQVA